ncbi:MAG: lipid-A-disaccharide synthase [cyanobacterium endosymbiont of Rhopalodia musculus]|uniref:lipid-A-disaccharide synthase n=1 Tax=cyanobacterium endosymbiont of Epithemia clementina EcSB TaxID=3034674 RepID=UPI0024811E0B|nr:lipid-A-disaccharide synthase [cyanobacterium endosymbiont of Epithemia clementina EcSB]WGT68262.1 lipid-A-disaccharide synthase [cyanobacterium endosymbiont of Epithemia clementina EcSB]
MRIFISTGEVSGDLQGSMLVEALYQQAKNQGIPLEILALGGDLMAQAGAKLLGNTAAIGSIGIVESLPFIIPTWLMQRRVKQYLRKNPPDILILIDYMGPNSAFGQYARKHFPEVPIIYYIAPQSWVWAPNSKTIQQFAHITDLLLAIFPEEARFFAEKGVTVKWVGHPLLDRMTKAPSREEARLRLNIDHDQTVVALFPASRYQELKYHLPLMCKAAQKLQEKIPDLHFLLPISLSEYRDTIKTTVNAYQLSITLLEGQEALEVMAAADFAIAKSGTVNLELALLRIPQLVLCLVNPLTMWIARNILKFSIPFMSPPNLVVMEEIVPELLQEEATIDRIVQESLELLLNPERRQKTLADYDHMCTMLGEVGVCNRVAIEILGYKHK